MGQFSVPTDTRLVAVGRSMLAACAITFSVLAAYLVLYTGYSKQNKNLDMSLLVTVLTCSKSVDHTLIELNKAISLAGLTVLAIPFLPITPAAWGHDLVFISMPLLVLHSSYSSFKY